MGRGSPVLPFDNYYFGRTERTVAAISLPPARPGGASDRSTVLRGLGPDQTKLTASGSVTGQFIYSAGHPFNPPTTRSTHKGPGVEDIYLNGGQPITGSPITSEDGVLTVADAIVLDGLEHYIKNVVIKKFRGRAIYIVTTNLNALGDVRVPRLQDILISHCHDGIVAQVVDVQANGIRLSDIRGIGFHDLGGNSQINNCHFYGCSTAIKIGLLDGGGAPTTGPGQCVDCTGADSLVGFQLDSANCRIHNCFTQHCFNTNIHAYAAYSNITGTDIYVARSTTIFPGILGLDIDGRYSRYTGGVIKLNDHEFPEHTGYAGSTGIRVGHSDCHIDCTIDAVANQADQVGILVDFFQSNPVFPLDFTTIRLHMSDFRGSTNQWGINAPGIGTYNVWDIHADTNQVGHYLQVPTHSATNVIRINGVAIPAGVAYP